MSTGKGVFGQLPDGARIKVLDENGHEKWRTLADFSDSDTIVYKTDGTPYTMVSRPGRRPKVEVIPSSPVAAQKMKDKRVSIENDDLVNVIAEKPDSSDVLNTIMQQMAEEAASLYFERGDAERQGKETSAISMRRVNTLKSMVETWFKKKEQDGQRGVDVDSPSFKTALSFVAETLRDTMLASNMRPEQVEALFARFAKKLDSDEWRAELSARLDGKRGGKS